MPHPHEPAQRPGRQVRLRGARPSDVASIRILNEAALPHVTSLSDTAAVTLLDQSSIALVAEEVDESAALVAFCMVLGPGLDYGSVNYRWVMDRYDDALYLDRVVVAADYRGQGIGQRIYAEVEHRMRTELPVYPNLGLEVNLDPPNPASLAFHTGLGFQAVGEQTTPYGARVVLMSKRVTTP